MKNGTKIRKWYPVASEDSIPLKEGRRVVWGNYEIALFNLGDEYLAVDNQCPHKQGPLADGLVAGKSVFCPLHNWKISLENGCALTGGKGRVRTYPVKLMHGCIHVALEEGQFQEEQASEEGIAACHERT